MASLPPTITVHDEDQQLQSETHQSQITLPLQKQSTAAFPRGMRAVQGTRAEKAEPVGPATPTPWTCRHKQPLTSHCSTGPLATALAAAINNK